MVTNLDLGIGYAHYLSDGLINNKQDFSLPYSGLGANFNIGLEYKIKAHLGFKISNSGEYYNFKDMYKKETTTNAFDKRSKLSLMMITPQVRMVYHF